MLDLCLKLNAMSCDYESGYITYSNLDCYQSSFIRTSFRLYESFCILSSNVWQQILSDESNSNAVVSGLIKKNNRLTFRYNFGVFCKLYV